MKLKLSLIILVFFLVDFSVYSKGNEELEKSNKPEDKIQLFKKLAQPLRRAKPDSALYYLKQGLDLAQSKKLAIPEASILRSIAMTYFIQKQYDTCVSINKKAISISEKYDDYKGLASSYRRIGLVERKNNELILAIETLYKSVGYYELANDSIRQCSVYLTIGNCHYQNGAYPDALEVFQKALQLSEQNGDHKTSARCLTNIANIQDELKNYPLALTYLQQAIDIKLKLEDNKGAFQIKENMAIIYSKTGDYEKALKQYEAVYNYKDSVIDEAGISVTLTNIGYTYEKMGKFNNALENYTQSLKIFYKLDDNSNIATCLNNIGDIYYALGKYKQAVDSSLKSLAIGRKLSSKAKVKSTALSLTKSYVEMNNFRDAYHYHVLYAQMKDSLFNEESAKLLQEMETKYQTEKKQQEIEKQSLKIDKQAAQSRSDRIMLWAMLGGIVLVLLIAIQIFRGYRQKKKANALLSDKNIEITSQKAEIEEKNLNIMDSIRYAKRIQQTILPREEFVEKHLPKSFILYKPKDIVSGDFYWVEKAGNKIYASAVDCTGHGVPGAFVSIVGYNSLNRTVMEFKLEKPSDILTKLNDLVVDTFVRHSDSDVKDGMDMSLLSIDTETQEIEFSGAQNPIYIVNKDELVEIKGDKHPIGSSLEAKNFANHGVTAQKGDMLYLFTDGYIDQFGGPKGKKFMRKRFKELLQSIQSMDVKTQKLHLDNTIMDWMKEEEQLDDILVIGIRV